MPRHVTARTRGIVPRALRRANGRRGYTVARLYARTPSNVRSLAKWQATW